MRIAADQSIAGYSAMVVRNFLKKYELTGLVAEDVQTSLSLSPRDASEFLNKLVALGLVRERHRQNGYPLFDLTDCGVRLAYASAATVDFSFSSLAPYDTPLIRERTWTANVYSIDIDR